MTLIEADRVDPTPWKNGGGRTRELFVWPPVGDWQLRISLADIEQDGPFSAFPGVHRHFAVLQGGGVRLHFADGERLLQAGDPPLAFDGASALGCTLCAGPTRDLNLMLRDVEGRMVLAADGASAPPDRPWRALFATGMARVGALTLPPRSLLLMPDAPLQKLDAAPAFWFTAELAP